MMRTVIGSLARARAAMLDRIKELDRQVLTAARANTTARLFMSVPGVGPITALSVASAFDDASRFKRSSSAGAYLGLTPRRYESGEMNRNGGISKHGNKMTRKHLYEAATTMLTRTTRFCSLKAWGLWLAKKVGFKKARVGVARKLAVVLHAMWKTNTPFRWEHSRRLIGTGSIDPPPTARPRRDAWRGSGRPAECRSLLKQRPERGPLRPIHHPTPTCGAHCGRPRREL
jgi:Transposase IS116/IS110/IS902 family